MKRVIAQRNKLHQFALFAKALFAALLLFSLSASPLNAYAYNEDYLDRTTWVSNDNIITEQLDVVGPFGEAYGSFSYYCDDSEYSFYALVSVCEDSISDNAQKIKLDFEIAGERDRYYFSCDDEGITDYSGNEDVLFNVAANFNSYPDTRSGEYIAAIDIDNGSSSNLISMFININGHRYSVFRDLFIEKPIPTKAEKTTKPKHTTTKKQGTTKAKKTSAKKVTSTKFSNSAGRVKPTKFVNDGYSPTDSSVKQNNEDVSAVEEVFEKPLGNHLSDKSRSMIIVGIIVGIIGLVIALYAIFSRDKEDENEEKAEPDDRTEDDDFDF